MVNICDAVVVVGGGGVECHVNFYVSLSCNSLIKSLAIYFCKKPKNPIGIFYLDSMLNTINSIF